MEIGSFDSTLNELLREFSYDGMIIGDEDNDNDNGDDDDKANGDDDDKANGNHHVPPSSFRHLPAPLAPPPQPFSLPPINVAAAAIPGPELVEEELEWISNKDAFPMVESLADIIPCGHLGFVSTLSDDDHHSPISVLENSSSSANSNGSSGVTTENGSTSAFWSFSSFLKVPVRARSKQLRKKRRDMLGPQWQCWVPGKTKKIGKPRRLSSTTGRACLHCQSEMTPQWRAGPMGPKTLCNACGVRYKSGRLVPEYRPASSPTFRGELHSNSHRKIMEMRKKKQMMETGNSVSLKVGAKS